ncbi:MAG: MarR family transcriptional regulator [Chloroflexi bacterium]|nr:MarR family transcriptional regulator [Chloroflexota bacterium]
MDRTMDKIDIEHSPGYVIARANWMMKNGFSRILREKGLDVTPEQWAVMYFAWETPGITQTELARRSLKDKTNVTRILDVLVKHQYVERRSDPLDRRAARIFLTEKGEAVLPGVLDAAMQSNREAVKDLDETQVRQLVSLLNQVVETLEKIPTQEEKNG